MIHLRNHHFGNRSSLVHQHKISNKIELSQSMNTHRINFTTVVIASTQGLLDN
jgi:hypothetical protein